jgi:hypothetical protein
LFTSTQSSLLLAIFRCKYKIKFIQIVEYMYCFELCVELMDDLSQCIHLSVHLPSQYILLLVIRLKSSILYGNNVQILEGCLFQLFLQMFKTNYSHYQTYSSFGHCVVCSSSFGHCVVCPSSICRFWLPLWYLQTFIEMNTL